MYGFYPYIRHMQEVSRFDKCQICGYAPLVHLQEMKTSHCRNCGSYEDYQTEFPVKDFVISKFKKLRSMVLGS